MEKEEKKLQHVPNTPSKATIVLNINSSALGGFGTFRLGGASSMPEMIPFFGAWPCVSPVVKS